MVWKTFYFRILVLFRGDAYVTLKSSLFQKRVIFEQAKANERNPSLFFASFVWN